MFCAKKTHGLIMAGLGRFLCARPGECCQSWLFNVCETIILYYNGLITVLAPRRPLMTVKPGAGLVRYYLPMRTLGLTIILSAVIPAFLQASDKQTLTDSEVQERVSRLNDEDADKKLKAIVDLKKARGAKRARKALVKALKREKNNFMRARIVESLSENPDEVAKETLMELVRSEKDKGVRQAAVSALSSIGAGAEPLLLERLGDEGEDAGVRLRAMDMLMQHPTEEVFAAYVRALDSKEPKVRVQAVVSLFYAFRQDEARVRPLLERMADDPVAGETARLYLKRLDGNY